MLLIGCGSGTSAPVAPPVPAVQALQAADVQNIVQAAVNSVNADMAVTVVDRAGFVLGVFRTQSAPATAVGNFGLLQNANDVAVALARTGAFFSNDQAPLSSRTVRFISGIHFPPGVMNQPPADLYGIENTNRGCTLVGNPAFENKIPPSLALGGGFGLRGWRNRRRDNVEQPECRGVCRVRGSHGCARRANGYIWTVARGSGSGFYRGHCAALRQPDGAARGFLRRTRHGNGNLRRGASKQPGAAAGG